MASDLITVNFGNQLHELHLLYLRCRHQLISCRWSELRALQRQTSSVSTLTISFMSVSSSRPESVFFMGLNLLTKTSMSPVRRACACCSVSPQVAKGGLMKTADAICKQKILDHLFTPQGPTCSYVPDLFISHWPMGGLM